MKNLGTKTVFTPTNIKISLDKSLLKKGYDF